MKSAFFISLILSLVVGFVIGAILGVQVVEVYVDKIPTDTMYTFIIDNVGLLGSFSSFLALVFAMLLFTGWRKQQKHILLIEHHKKLLESIAKLGSTFRLHINTRSYEKNNSKIFFDELNEQLINISQLITVHYILIKTKRAGCTYIDCAFDNLGDFLDPVKDYYLFINDYYSRSIYQCAYFSDTKKQMVYLSLDSDVAKDIFRDAEKETNYNAIDISTYNLRVAMKFDLAVDAIQSEIG